MLAARQWTGLDDGDQGALVALGLLVVRMQAAVGQLTKSNLVHDVRKKIARVKTIVQQQAKSGKAS
jgi:hypothetical protein